MSQWYHNRHTMNQHILQSTRLPTVANRPNGTAGPRVLIELVAADQQACCVSQASSQTFSKTISHRPLLLMLFMTKQYMCASNIGAYAYTSRNMFVHVCIKADCAKHLKCAPERTKSKQACKQQLQSATSHVMLSIMKTPQEEELKAKR